MIKGILTISLKDQLNNDLFLIKHDFVTEGRNTIFFDKEDAITKYHQADKETLSFKMYNFCIWMHSVSLHDTSSYYYSTYLFGDHQIAFN